MSNLTSPMNQVVPEKFQQRYEQLQQDLLELQRSIASVTETAYSDGRLVAATVGARGELTDLALDPRIYRTTNASALAKTIKETIWQATELATARIVELTRPLVPEGMDMDLEAALRRMPAKAGDR